MAALVIAAAIPIEWITLSQSRYGLALDGVRAQQRYNSSDSRPEAVLGWLWAAPNEHRNTSRGLGGGITWAWDERLLCTQLQPRFRASFMGVQWDTVSCEDLRRAMTHAFDAWSAA